MADLADPDELQRRLDAARRTIEALTARLEALDAGPPGEVGALSQALAGVQRELAQRTRVLEETEATWRALYESTPDPLLTVDADGLVIAANRTAQDALGVHGALIGTPLADQLDPADASDLERLAARGWRGASERRFTLRDGRRISLNARPIPGSRDGRHHVTVHDVSHREVLEGAEEERRRMQVLAGLAGGLARELNDPMSVVQGRLELLLEVGATSSEAVERHLTVALAHARRVTAMLQNLRLVGRVPATHIERVGLLEAWEAAREILGPRLGDVELTLDMPDLCVGGTSALLARAFANLVDRVLDFCGRDARLSITARPADHGATLRIQGRPRNAPADPALPGSDESHLDDGGLATSVARTLLRGVGGQLDARSAGRRAVYDLVLPAPPAVRAKARPVHATVLVVGDDALVRAVEEALGREGYSIVTVRDAEQALQRLADGPEVEGVIAALLLPGASGLSLFDEVHRDFPDLRGRLVLVSDTPHLAVPPTVRLLGPPLRSADLLGALGRRVRGRR